MPHPDACHRLAPADPDRVRVIQLTDSHILAGAGERMRGVDTRRSFEAVIDFALASGAVPDLLLLTGDLSQDGSAESYRYLSRRLNASGFPVFYLPGNHDDTERMREHLTGDGIHHARRVVAGCWQIVLLDSTVDGEVGGCLAQAQLDFLHHTLAEHADRHALVCLHHQAIETGSRWIDALGLENAGEFRQELARHRNVRAVLWGHVHQEARHTRDGIEWMSTPSSCVQFKPGSAEFAIGDEAPGYRYLELVGDGRIETRVTRLPDATPS